MKPWNTTMNININLEMYDKFGEWLKENDKKRKKAFLPKDLQVYIKKLYEDEEYGIKVIARAFSTTYTKMRFIIKTNDIKIRRGKNIVTDRVKKFRSARVKGTNNPWSDNECRKNIHSFGIQGYYNTGNNEKIWLRSTWEYIYAKWLDKNNYKWSYEEKQFLLKNGESYKPDFFLNGKIVEIKGFNKDKLYKVDMLRKEYNIEIIVIEDITPYCETTYGKELNEWKQKRLLK